MSWIDGWMDGWLTCNFMSFSKIFQSYQDNGLVIMKGCVQWNPVYNEKDLCPRFDSNPRPLDVGSFYMLSYHHRYSLNFSLVSRGQKSMALNPFLARLDVGVGIGISKMLKFLH